MAKTKQDLQETAKQPKDVAAEIFEAVKAKEMDRFPEFLHEDATDDFVAIGQFFGRDAIRGFFEELYAAFPVFTIEVERIIGDDSHAVVQWEASGTFSGGPFQGIEPTGKDVRIRGVDVMEFEEGKVRHNTIYYDGAAFARQVGMLPRAGGTADRAVLAGFNAVTRLRSKVRTRS